MDDQLQPPRQPIKKSKPSKELRFITNNGAPHPKRRRVSAACLTCRKRKVACSGERPACVTCTQVNIDCAGYDGSSSSSSGVTATSKPDIRARDSTADAHEAKPGTRSIPSASGTHDSHPRKQSKVKLDRSQPVAGLQSASGVDHDTRMPRQMPSIQEERSSLGSGSGGSGSSGSLFAGPRNRMPYFRWLGPTAIMPGFKQMVVKVKSQDASNGVSSNHSGEGAMPVASPPVHRTGSVLSTSPLVLDAELRTPLTLPFYDTSPMPPSELITHLCNTFFVHLACNFPFLQRDRFLKDLEEKQVDAILVDAVCALAARFSTHQLLTNNTAEGTKPLPSEQGSAFAQRAKAALTHTFAAPSIAAVQAALILAYNEFGESRDSGLWMYLGIAIRLAEDLGLQKLDGLCYEGRDGPTPKMVKGNVKSQEMDQSERQRYANSPPNDGKDEEEHRAIERERVDTFWAVFFLDRVVSSGTGRRSTIRDKDIDLSFPSLETCDPKTGWPSPFPALIRIVHLYGRVTDLLNGIKEPSDVTQDTPRKLADMETRVTNFYQGLSSKLHFQAMNFHHYVKAGEGTNFVLLHIWFHTLIVLLHQPTLLKTFEGNMLQLFPNSQHISMSSAKTIADILSYSQLIDTKAGLGNPFTTQPIYIAACAFLRESAEQTATSKEQSRVQSTVASRAASRAGSPSVGNSGSADPPNSTTSATHPFPLTAADRLLARHTLLATAASQHYQLCYKALESIEVYWAGTKYILTVLDQKFKGVGDPLLYTAEEVADSIEKPNPEVKEAFRRAGWRRKIDWAGLRGSWLGGVGVSTSGSMNSGMGQGRAGAFESTEGNDPNSAIGWTLTGTLNSPSTNLAWHFPSMPPPTSSYHRGSSQHIDPLASNFDFTSPPLQPSNAPANTHYRTASTGSLPRPPSTRFHSASAASLAAVDDSLLLDPNLSLPLTSTTTSRARPMTQRSHVSFPNAASYDLNGYTIPNFHNNTAAQMNAPMGLTTAANAETGESVDESMPFFGDMLIESQDVDTSLLGLDTLPWLDMELPLPTDLGLDGFEGLDTHTGGQGQGRTHDQGHGAND